MLVDPVFADPYKSFPMKRVTTGVWYFQSFNPENAVIHPVGYPSKNEVITYWYGVCDVPVDILLKPVVNNLISNRFDYTIFLCLIRKEHEPPRGGWRWSKWGPYIGHQKPTTEYLYDEPLIEEVCAFTILGFTSPALTRKDK